MVKEPNVCNVCKIEYYVAELDYVVSIVVEAETMVIVDSFFNILYGSPIKDPGVSLTGMNCVDDDLTGLLGRGMHFGQFRKSATAKYQESKFYPAPPPKM